jgi:DNA-binding transcriptional ArsR family regulator
MKKIEVIQVKKEDVRKVTNFVRVIDNKLRWDILICLYKGRKNVTQLIELLGKEQSAISVSLKYMRDIEVVSTEREGKFIYYRINATGLLKMEKIISILK